MANTVLTMASVPIDNKQINAASSIFQDMMVVSNKERVSAAWRELGYQEQPKSFPCTYSETSWYWPEINVLKAIIFQILG